MGNQLSAIARNDFEEIEHRINELQPDADKFYENGNKAAGTRLRKGLLEISKLCGSARANVQFIKNAEKKEPDNFL